MTILVDARNNAISVFTTLTGQYVIPYESISTLMTYNFYEYIS